MARVVRHEFPVKPEHHFACFLPYAFLNPLLTLTIASEKCQQEKRKTVNGEDILFAMTSLGFENYAEALKIYLAKYREVSLPQSFCCSLSSDSFYISCLSTIYPYNVAASYRFYSLSYIHLHFAFPPVLFKRT